MTASAPYRSIPCPRCGAAVGKPCVGIPSGKPTSHIHAVREISYWKQLRPNTTNPTKPTI